MPTYEYHCDKCGLNFEEVQKITADPLTSCPDCGGSVHKLIAGGNFILKGNGWYKTDYASPSAAAEKAGCAAEKSGPACQGCPASKPD